MIWESAYWKELLWRHARDLERRGRQRSWPERSFAKVEQTVMLGAYAIRKLIEAKKLTVDIANEPVQLLAFPWSGTAVTLMNWHHLERLYDLDAPGPCKKKLIWLCNSLVHSYVFCPSFGEEGGLATILFNSDRTKQEALYSIETKHLAELFAGVAADEASYAEYWRLDPEKGDFEVRLRQLPPQER